MSAKNSVLLIIKHNQGIDYNSLLNKIAGNYSDLNSARAALSRTLKDLRAFGMVKKHENHLYVTDAAEQELNKEMKNKLLLKLNQMIASKNNYLEIDAIVKYLHALIERSKADPDLLKAAKGSMDFYLNDLVEINKKIDERIKHLNYISNVFGEQIKSLQELDFNDLKIRKLDKDNADKILNITKKIKAKRVSIESNDQPFLDNCIEKFQIKRKGSSLSFDSKKLSKVLKEIEEGIKNNPNLIVTLYLSSLKIKFFRNEIIFIGTYSDLIQKFGDE